MSRARKKSLETGQKPALFCAFWGKVRAFWRKVKGKPGKNDGSFNSYLRSRD